MAHGPDTEELLRRIRDIDWNRSSIWYGTLRVSGLNITSLPDLDPRLIMLDCNNTRITALPRLPPGLRSLKCHTTPLKHLGVLPAELRVLHCDNTPLLTLGDRLPRNLHELRCHNTQIEMLPDLPRSLTIFTCHNTRLPQRIDTEGLPEYKVRFSAWKAEEELASRTRVQGRNSMVAEELAMVMWHPNRVERWLTTGGFELLEAV
jgi:hypothetical protein